MIQGNIRQDLLTMVPVSTINEISCFVFFDKHPRAERVIDVLVCTQRGEVIEYYKRDRISSLLLELSKKFLEVRTFRNNNCDLYYFVVTEDELFILSCKEKLTLKHKINEIESYEIYDSMCSGQASLKIIRKDDAVPLYYDDNFEKLSERCINFETLQSNDQAPILMQLTRKLTEAKYNLQCNEKKLNEFVHLRQVATFYLYQKICPNLNNCMFNINAKEIISKMHLKTWTPWIKLCNKKVVIGFTMLNEDTIPLEEVYILLNSSLKSSLVYWTKIFDLVDKQWIEKDNQNISTQVEVAIVTSIDLRELQNNITDQIILDMVLTFKKAGKDYLLPFEKVCLTSADIMGTDFDVLANPHTDEKHVLLAVLATSNKTTLSLRHIKNKEDELNITEIDIFCKYLKMEQFKIIEGAAIHKISPYHTLHGILVIFDKNKLDECGKFTIEVHSRCPAQVLSLIHFINDMVPFRIIVTTSNYKIAANMEQLSHYNEDVPFDSTQGRNYLDCGLSMLNQTSMLLEYLDKCMIKMNESKNPTIQGKIGSEIDVFACGLEEFKKLRENLLNEVYSGIHKLLNQKPIPEQGKSAEMIIDE